MESGKTIHDMSRELRKLRAEHNEQRARELIMLFEQKGIHVEAGSEYGSTNLSIRFDDALSMLNALPDPKFDFAR